MRGLPIILGLALAGLLLAAPEAAEARRCWCSHGWVHTSRSCAEACGRRSYPGSIRREEKAANRQHDRRADEQAARARRARGAAASGAATSSSTPRRRYRRQRDVPQQQGLTNLDEKPVSGSLEGVFCSEGEVLFPKRPTLEMLTFCIRQDKH